MAGPDGPARRARTALVMRNSRGLFWLAPALLALLGCGSGGSKPAALPPVTEIKTEAPKPETAGEDPVASPTPPTTVVIDRGDDKADKGPKSLAVAAEEERERRAQAGKPVAVIDNKNLAEFSKGQKLTVAEGTPAPAAATPAADAAAAKAVKDEAYWRSRGLEIRRRWRESADKITELEGKAAELRTRFYAADDPYLRDSQIKPEWDHALEDLDATRRESERAEDDLERYLDEGRQAGAFPGWLREGAELEPEHRPAKKPNAEPTEPVEVQGPQTHP